MWRNILCRSASSRGQVGRVKVLFAAVMLMLFTVTTVSNGHAYDLSIYPEISRASKAKQAQPAPSRVTVPSRLHTPAMAKKPNNAKHATAEVAREPDRSRSRSLGYYLGGRLLPGMSTIQDENLINGEGGNFSKLGDEFDSTFGASAVAGYHWNKHGFPLRTEIEIGYRHRNDFNTQELNNSPTPPNIGYKNDLSTYFVMLNGYFDITTDTAWRPYVGAGVGWARNSSSTTRDTALPADTPQELDNDVDNFAFSFSLGTRVAISSNWVGDLGYRFISFGEVDTGAFSGGDKVTADDHFTHDIVLGISYLF